MPKNKDKDAADSRPDYWLDYSPLQKTKHELISEYLKGWFPKLGSWAGRVLYFDTHAGRGAHSTGQAGSPLVALSTFLSHSSRDRILAKSEVRFLFVERDSDNAIALRNELGKFRLPNGVHVEITCDDCFSLLEGILEDLASKNNRMAPAFVFVDPYGFKVPGKLLRELMKHPQVELFINVIWRELNMGIGHARRNPGSKWGETMDEIFDGRAWLDRIVSSDIDARAEECITLFREMCAAKWATWVHMLGDNGATRYMLLHLTNHDAGRDLMKDCVWKVCPEGGFYARKSDDPTQGLLITPNISLGPLRQWVVDRVSAAPRRWEELENEVRPMVWRPAQMNSVVRELRREKVIEASEYEGIFSRKANPLLSLRKDD